MMNAAVVTHGLKLIGGNTRMWVGVLVIALAAALLVYFLEQERRKRPGHSQF
jgi:uncharacterized membrane protein